MATSTPPRPARFNVGVILCLAGGGLGAAVTGGLTAVFLVMGGAPWVDAAIDRAPAHAEARAVDSPELRKHGRSRDRYRVEVAFTPPGGSEVHGHVWVGGAGLVDAQRGSPIPVEFDSTDPAHVRAVGQRASLFGSAPMWTGLASVVCLLLVLVGGVLLARRMAFAAGARVVVGTVKEARSMGRAGSTQAVVVVVEGAEHRAWFNGPELKGGESVWMAVGGNRAELLGLVT